jgi:XTP/dITP diphosphohydrolase
MRLIFATYNPGKMDEVRALGQKYGVDVVSMTDAGAEVHFEETGDTFEANARSKLRQAQAALVSNSDDWVAADDSGITIDALGGEPGVKTRRWIGREMTDQEIIDYTLERMAVIPNAQRTARFVSVVAMGKAGQNPLTFEGSLDGSILLLPDIDTTPKEGFPFRQIFFVPEAGLTMGQLETAPPEKQVLTFRQRAFTKAFRYLNDLQSVTGQFE